LGRRRPLNRRHGCGRQLYIGLGRLGRHVGLVLPYLAVSLWRHLVARPLVRDHLRQRLRRIGLLILCRWRRCGRIRLLIGLLVLRRSVYRGLRLRWAVHRPLLDRRGLLRHGSRLRICYRGCLRRGGCLRLQCRRLGRS